MEWKHVFTGKESFSKIGEKRGMLFKGLFLLGPLKSYSKGSQLFVCLLVYVCGKWTQCVLSVCPWAPRVSRLFLTRQISIEKRNTHCWNSSWTWKPCLLQLLSLPWYSRLGFASSLVEPILLSADLEARARLSNLWDSHRALAGVRQCQYTVSTDGSLCTF